MQNKIDELQLKIEKARAELSENTRKAIDAVPWQASILKLRETKGYSFEQLSDLELETELLLCGLLSSEDYPKEVEDGMKITNAEANELVNEMNKLVFSKIKEELVKITERKPLIPQEENAKSVEEEKKASEALNVHGIEIIDPKKTTGLEQKNKEKLPIPEKLNLGGGGMPPILMQKMSAPVQMPSVKTEHSPENITKTSQPSNIPPASPLPETPKTPTTYPKNADPYRLPPEE